MVLGPDWVTLSRKKGKGRTGKGGHTTAKVPRAILANAARIPLGLWGHAGQPGQSLPFLGFSSRAPLNTARGPIREPLRGSTRSARPSPCPLADQPAYFAHY